MGALGVNWDDALTQDINVDLVKIGIAQGPTDNCVITDVYTGAVSKTNGGVQTFPGVVAHGHFAKKIKCLPW